MGFVACGHHTWTPGTVLPPIPSDNPPGEGYEPPTAGPQRYSQPITWRVAVASFPAGQLQGILWGARIEQGPHRRQRSAGAHSVEISAPLNGNTMRVLGTDTRLTEHGRSIYRVANPIRWELLVGYGGKVTDRFVVRDEVRIRGDRVFISGVGITGLAGDRVIGAPTRLNLLGGAGSFERGTLRGWRLVGNATGGVQQVGGPDGEWSAWVKGTPDGNNYLEAVAHYAQPARPWGRQRIAGVAYVKLPGGGLDIDDYALITVNIRDHATGLERWPAGRDDLESAIVESDMVRGSWIEDQVVAIGYLPTPPFDVDVWIRLHPVDEDEETEYDGAGIIRRENTTTFPAGTPVDTTQHIVRLWDHFNRGTDKSPMGVKVVVGEPTGVEKVRTWWHEDGVSGPEAIEAVCGEEGGPDVWDDASQGRAIKVAKRRGSKRDDLILHRWDCLAIAEMSIDPGAQKTAIRATSSAGSIWGGADEGAIDTTRTGGIVIDVNLAGPSGLRPNELQAWVNAELAARSLLPASKRLYLPFRLATRIAVGDSLRAPITAGSAMLSPAWYRVTDWEAYPDRNLVTVDLGTDPDLGGTA
jgi:hypothetical protein